jgi:hypothetical protein
MATNTRYIPVFCPKKGKLMAVKDVENALKTVDIEVK